MTVINKLLSSYQSYYAAKPAQLNKIWQGIKPNKLQKFSYPADTITISAENKVKTIKNVVKETSTPIETIDANDRIFGNVVPDAKRYKTFAKYFSHMFGKTIHVRQAKAMYEKYKQLGAINDFEEFSKKAFEQVDILVSPTCPTTAFDLNSKANNPLEMYLTDIATISSNLVGAPALSMPVGFDKDKMPIGLQVIAKNLDEMTLLQSAYALEQELGVYQERPNI